ncbi:MAG: hypothetical protein QXW39_02435 [Candidatus Bathyarchaeia archaeon]
MQTVFSDAGALLHDYVSVQLPHRRRELDRLIHYFQPAAKGVNVSVKVHVIGPVGSVKTVLCRRAGLHIAREPGAASSSPTSTWPTRTDHTAQLRRCTGRYWSSTCSQGATRSNPKAAGGISVIYISRSLRNV